VTVDRERLLVELVDREGKALGACPVGAAHTAPGRLHRAFSVLLYDPAGRVLLQQRAAVKTRFALRWSNTCCGHPAPGQDPAAAATTRLAEELGITAAQITPLAEAGVLRYRAEDAATKRVEYEWDHVFVATLTDGAPAPDESEVRAVRWASPGPLAAEIDARPGDFTPWFAGVLDLAGKVRPGRLRAENRGDRLDLDKLVLVAEHGDAEQGARDVVRAERVPHHVPGGHQVLLPARRDQHPGAYDVFHGRAGVREGGPHVLERLRGLARVVAHGRGRAVLVQRARPGEEDEPRLGGRGGGVGVLGDTGQGRRADQRDGMRHARQTTASPRVNFLQ
jgi:isopentenyl-diphosphate delta-isomerase